MKPFLFGEGEVRISSARSSNSKWALLFQPDGFAHLYATDGRFVRVLPRSIRSDTQPVFSRTSPDHVYTVDGISVRKHSLIDDSMEVVASFPEYAGLSAAHAEGDLTPDGWIALCGVDQDGAEHIFCYNVETKQRGEVWKNEGFLDGLKAAFGGWLIASGDRIRAFPPKDLPDRMPHLIAEANGHACTAVHEGRPVLLWCNSHDPSVVPYNNAIEIIDIETAERRVLKSFDKRYAMHVTASEKDAFPSLYDPSGKLPFQIWRLAMDGSSEELLHEWHGPYNPVYTPRASYSNGLLLFNGWDESCKVEGLQVASNIAENAVLPPAVPGVRIDYSSFVGKKYWEMWPRTDGGLDIIEKLVKP